MPPQATDLSHFTGLTESTNSSMTQETTLSEIPESQMSINQKKITCRWTDDDDRALVRCLLDEKAAHPSAINGFKPVSWAQAVVALDGSELANGSKAKDVSTCKSRWQALKKMYISFRTVRNMSGAGWDESSMMVTLPSSVWAELALNTSATGKDLSRWQNRSFPLFHDLMALVEGKVATGDLMETTEDEENTDERDVGNAVPLDSQLEGSDAENVDENDEPVIEAPPVSSTPASSKRKRGSAMSPDVFLSELRTMSSDMAKSMCAPIPPISFTQQAPPPSFHMQAIDLIQKDKDLVDVQIFEAIDFLHDSTHAETYVALSEALRSTWLRMKLGW
ncbi:uncharacterized protein PGTG_08783 [Puccinia graminis f. sp. tritici CRL 75-36-700-3]|uniref:Myb/SANT-like domain-containing protein n=1 Tax=Puccinia graminis f. sp. tritici (strain CRL 75-36-700-3 / race SCCL) TaxID=418459 RepID=E3KE33_PUCGT|nr:uncharacterized protein PGTG_08783 [Puccinia graminis f. sp. tritici CRL 75-36-700-3]EFP82587.1 hypothetical protein PGTG_08783 [Puccinia graminis f. sp. tritici CRL 75-36-700-3]